MSEEGTGVRDRDVMTEAEIRGRGSCEDDTLLALSMEEGGLGSRSAGSFLETGKDKKQTCPRASRSNTALLIHSSVLTSRNISLLF